MISDIWYCNHPTPPPFQPTKDFLGTVTSAKQIRTYHQAVRSLFYGKEGI